MVDRGRWNLADDSHCCVVSYNPRALPPLPFRVVTLALILTLPSTSTPSPTHPPTPGKRGTAVTFFTEEDIPRLRPIANVIKLSGCPVPDWMLTIRAMKTKERKQLRLSAPRRREINVDEVIAKKSSLKKQQLAGQDQSKPSKQLKQSKGHDGEPKKKKSKH